MVSPSKFHYLVYRVLLNVHLMKMNVSDIFNSCRLCLGRSNSYVDIFDADGEIGFRAAEVINEILQLDVFKDDGYPETICSPCLYKILDFKRFKCTCLESKHKLQYAIAQKNGANHKCWTSNWHYSYSVQKSSEKPFGIVSSDNNNHSEVLCDDLANMKHPQNSQMFWMNDGLSLLSSSKTNPTPQVEVLLSTEIKGEMNVKLSSEQRDRNAAFYQAEDQSSKSSICVHDRIPKPEIEIPKIGVVKNEIDATKPGSQVQEGHSDNSCFVEYVSASNSISSSVKIEGNISGRNITNIGELVYKYEPVESSLISSCTNASSFPKISPEQLIMSKNCSISANPDRIAAKSFVGSQANLMSLFLKGEPGLFNDGSSQINSIPKVPVVISGSSYSIPESALFKCSECGKSFGDELLLKNHVGSGGCDKKVIYCIKCKKNISGLRRFQKHVAYCGIYRCPVCKNAYKGKVATRDHVRTHYPNRRYACSVCFERFEGRNDLILHVSSKHGSRSYKCDGCDRCYLKKAQYNKHILKCSRNVFICNMCNSPYLRKYPLKLHIWKYHMNFTLFKCNDCGQEFKQRKEFDLHFMNCNLKIELGKISYKFIS
ncbi:hypothetical protein J437_LFUL017807 [Ladona fulva]|uniref:Uncharacterized protein n=1 Tax=Ladona fulva TaxID=123851 RepID=A0A8K0KQG6_LADFU|nr:hypothetical protein J437_LFUL017807 [Ladona fulva]